MEIPSRKLAIALSNKRQSHIDRTWDEMNRDKYRLSLVIINKLLGLHRDAKYDSLCKVSICEGDMLSDSRCGAIMSAYKSPMERTFGIDTSKRLTRRESISVIGKIVNKTGYRLVRGRRGDKDVYRPRRL